MTSISPPRRFAGKIDWYGGKTKEGTINKFGFANKVSYISTGGGAMLEFLEGKELPGVIALS